MKHTTILGAGISGLGTSYHAGHGNCTIFEASDHYGGHTHSQTRDGFTWDDGPHVNYGKHDYVRELFYESVNNEVLEFNPIIRNYYRGHFIDHPAQSNLYKVPEPLRTECLNSFLATRARMNGNSRPANYQEWICNAFGPVFAETFPAAYTRKYWTTEPANLGVDWLEFVTANFPRRSADARPTRIFYPSIEDVKGGFNGPLGRTTFYTNTFRYPKHGGFLSFLRKMADGIRIHYRKRLTRVNFSKRELGFSDGTHAEYDTLVSTIPLNVLIECAEDAPAEVKEAGSLLRCTSMLLIEVTANHPTKRDDHYLYIYDEDKIASRITVTERFSPFNAPPGMTGLSAEVYGSPYRPLPMDWNAVARKVHQELIEIGLLENLRAITSSTVRLIPHAQVIFDHNRQPALTRINGFLDDHKVIRLGRYSEWDYLMTHDCVMGSRQISEEILNPAADASTSAVPGKPSSGR